MPALSHPRDEDGAEFFNRCRISQRPVVHSTPQLLNGTGNPIVRNSRICVRKIYNFMLFQKREDICFVVTGLKFKKRKKNPESNDAFKTKEGAPLIIQKKKKKKSQTLDHEIGVLMKGSTPATAAGSDSTM